MRILHAPGTNAITSLAQLRHPARIIIISYSFRCCPPFQHTSVAEHDESGAGERKTAGDPFLQHIAPQLLVSSEYQKPHQTRHTANITSDDIRFVNNRRFRKTEKSISSLARAHPNSTCIFFLA